MRRDNRFVLQCSVLQQQGQIRKENKIYLITLKLVVDIVRGSVAQQGNFCLTQQFVTIENKI